MDLFALTRQLIDIESVSGNEAAVGRFLHSHLTALGYEAQLVPVEGARCNVYAIPSGGSKPVVVFSTHMDVVPPWFGSSEDGDNIYGRGACDAKGIIAAQIGAAERLRREGVAVGLLFLVGEELDNRGAKIANQMAHQLHDGACRFLINGEPTDNRLGLASKGSLRADVIASGKLAHSAYPELGESAIEKLLTALERLRKMPLPQDREVGPCTMNIGTIEGGRAPNVIADHAMAKIQIRLVGPSEGLKKKILEAVGELAEVKFVLDIPFVRLQAPEGFATMIAAYTTDIPGLTNWGEPSLLGPGSIHVAHTEREFISKKEMAAAVGLYVALADRLLRS